MSSPWKWHVAFLFSTSVVSTGGKPCPTHVVYGYHRVVPSDIAFAHKFRSPPQLDLFSAIPAASNTESKERGALYQHEKLLSTQRSSRSYFVMYAHLSFPSTVSSIPTLYSNLFLAPKDRHFYPKMRTKATAMKTTKMKGAPTSSSSAFSSCKATVGCEEC